MQTVRPAAVVRGLRGWVALEPVFINSLRPDGEVSERHLDDFAIHLPQSIVQF